MEEKRKILFFADYAAEHSMRWSKYFALLGHDVYLITWNHELDQGSYRDKEEVIKSFLPVQVKVLGRNKYFFGRIGKVLSIIFQVRSLVKSIDPDIIHSHSLGAYSWITLFIFGIRTTLTPWGTDVLIDIKKSFFNRLFSILSMKKSNLITSDALHIKKELVELGINTSKIKLIYFGTDVELYSRNLDSRKRIREKYNISPEDIVVISTRTLNPIHDVITTVKSVKTVVTKNPSIKYFIASDGAQREYLEEYIRENDLQKSVFFPGYMTTSQMVDYLSASDIYVSTSIADAGLAASTAEAMSALLPCIVTDNAENALWIDTPKAGFLIQDKDYQALSEKILSLASNKNMIEELGRNARIKIEKDNNYIIEMNKMNELYRSILRD